VRSPRKSPARLLAFAALVALTAGAAGPPSDDPLVGAPPTLHADVEARFATLRE